MGQRGPLQLLFKTLKQTFGCRKSALSCLSEASVDSIRQKKTAYISFLTAGEHTACGYQELGLTAYPGGTPKQEIPILICTCEEALVPQPVPQMAAVGISGTDVSEQPLKGLLHPSLLLHPYLPAASLPTTTLLSPAQLNSSLNCQSRLSQLETRSPQVPRLILSDPAASLFCN